MSEQLDIYRLILSHFVFAARENIERAKQLIKRDLISCCRLVVFLPKAVCELRASHSQNVALGALWQCLSLLYTAGKHAYVCMDEEHQDICWCCI